MTRTVTPLPRPKPDEEMGLIGLLVAAVTAVILLPLLPVLAAVKVADWLRGGPERGSRDGGRPTG